MVFVCLKAQNSWRTCSEFPEHTSTPPGSTLFWTSCWCCYRCFLRLFCLVSFFSIIDVSHTDNDLFEFHPVSGYKEVRKVIMALPPNKTPRRRLSNNRLSSVHSPDNDEHNQPLIYLLNFSASLEVKWSFPKRGTTKYRIRIGLSLFCSRCSRKLLRESPWVN